MTCLNEENSVAWQKLHNVHDWINFIDNSWNQIDLIEHVQWGLKDTFSNQLAQIFDFLAAAKRRHDFNDK